MGRRRMREPIVYGEVLSVILSEAKPRIYSSSFCGLIGQYDGRIDPSVASLPQDDNEGRTWPPRCNPHRAIPMANADDSDDSDVADGKATKSKKPSRSFFCGHLRNLRNLRPLLCAEIWRPRSTQSHAMIQFYSSLPAPAWRAEVASPASTPRMYANDCFIPGNGSSTSISYSRLT